MSDAYEAASDGERQRVMRDAALAALRALGGDPRIDAIRSRVLANGEHVLDHELLMALAELRREGLVESLPGARWKLSDPPASAMPAAGDPDPDGRLAELRAMTYADYLQTPEWLRTRAAAIERAGGCCRLHEGHREHLDVYHRTRERLGAEPDTDLVVLCRSCHLLYRRVYNLTPREDAVADVPEPPPAAATRQRGVSGLRTC